VRGTDEQRGRASSYDRHLLRRTSPVGIVRAFLAGEAAALGLASLVHRGLIVEGYTDLAASTAEGTIAIVLAIGLAATYAFPRSTRGIGLAAQAFALAGTSIGLFLVLTGIGPSTVPDIVFHVGIFVVLILGLVVTVRWRPEAE
jgi:hypothetical protein